ncbi:MAG: HAMP domain-containing histidine kinase [Roseburia sp.]|nr:HAMP domain-containing histidine kinase [Roseburia sp.]
MKITWKIFFSTVFAMTVTFCIAGWFLISAFFESGYERAVGSAVDVSRMFLRTFGNYMVTVSDEEKETQRNISILAGELREENIHIYIKREDGTEVFSDVPFQAELTDADTGAGQELTYLLVKNGENYYIQINSSIQVEKVQYHLVTFHNVTGLFRERQEHLGIYNRFLLWFLLIDGIVSWILARIIVKPIRKISQSARKIADGNLECRISIRNQDEIGDMAVNFNRMAEHLSGKILELEDAARRQEEFVGSFAHELKTPLTSIIGYADLLRSNQYTEEEQFECANYIFHEGKRLESLSLRLLELIVLEKKELIRKKVRAEELIHRVAGVMVPVMEEEGVEFVFGADAGILFVEPELICSVITNLIDNARKSGCRIIRLCGKQEDGGYFIDVCDDGRGIPEKELERITEAFYMVDKSRSREQGGAGLGLAISSRIIELHRAELAFQSKVGEGTRVRLKFSSLEEKEEGVDEK